MISKMIETLFPDGIGTRAIYAIMFGAVVNALAVILVFRLPVDVLKEVAQTVFGAVIATNAGIATFFFAQRGGNNKPPQGG